MSRRDARVPRRRALQAFVAVALCAIVALILPACDSRSAPASTGPRIVALSPAVAIMLRDMGHADKIVGRHGYDLVLDPSIPVCGDQAGINYEALIKSSPTHVFTQWGSRELPTRLTDLARDRSWVLLDSRLLTLDDITNAAKSMEETIAAYRPPNAVPAPTADIFDTPMGPPLSQKLARAFEPRPPAARRDLFQGPVLLLVSTKSPSALGPGSFHHQLLERLGGSPAITSGNPYIELSAEDIVKLAPQGIILFMPKPPDSFRKPVGTEADDAEPTAEERLGVLRGLAIPAVQSGRVALIDDPRSLTPSSALLSVMGEMERILRDWNKSPG